MSRVTDFPPALRFKCRLALAAAAREYSDLIVSQWSGVDQCDVAEARRDAGRLWGAADQELREWAMSAPAMLRAELR